MIDQQGDVFLFQTNNDGDINVVDGIVEMNGGLETSVYLALFGGNDTDAGGDDTKFEFWGNIGETEKAKKYRSETQYLLKSLVITSASLLRIEKAALRDLAYLLDIKAANDLSVFASIPGLNKIKIVVTITAEGDETQFEFVENWKGAE